MLHWQLPTLCLMLTLCGCSDTKTRRFGDKIYAVGIAGNSTDPKALGIVVEISNLLR